MPAISRSGHAEKTVNLASDRFGRLDILVNNAGGGIIRAFHEQTPETLKTTIDRNLWTVLWCSWYAVRKMRAQAYGRIINLGADSFRNGLWDHAAYNAAKGGVHGLTTGMARNLPRTASPSIPVAPAREYAADGGDHQEQSRTRRQISSASFPWAVRPKWRKSPRWFPISLRRSIVRDRTGHQRQRRQHHALGSRYG
jgi:NAD(P)-dependent dehydrogenase (short-subunit alcohol dehydrogenase family)